VKMKKRYVLMVFDSAEHVCRLSARCLLAVLLCGCDASLGADEPPPAPESLREHTTSTQKEAKNVAQRNATVSASSQPEGDREPVNTTSPIDSTTEQLEAIIHNNGGRGLQGSEPLLDPQEILDRKLADLDLELSTAQSISLIDHCAQLGGKNVARAADKEEVIMVLGNAGAGKSTAVNYLIGCEMKSVRCSEISLEGRLAKRVVVVAPTSPRPEVVSIGHGEIAHTLLPTLVLDPDNESRAYCDCPGFDDGRGTEINIANAVNTRKVLHQAKSVKVLLLVEYSDLTGSRGSHKKAAETAPERCTPLHHQDATLRRW
jgi:hypothetical protein